MTSLCKSRTVFITSLRLQYIVQHFTHYRYCNFNRNIYSILDKSSIKIQLENATWNELLYPKYYSYIKQYQRGLYLQQESTTYSRTHLHNFESWIVTNIVFCNKIYKIIVKNNQNHKLHFWPNYNYFWYFVNFNVLFLYFKWSFK